MQPAGTLLYPPSERSETGGDHVLLAFPSVLPSVCEQSINRLWRHRCTVSVNLFVWYNCFNRNTFNSCVKSWEYFRSDNISLETSLSWLYDDIVRFKMEMGLRRNVQKCTPCPSDVLASLLAAASCYTRWGYNVIGGITYFHQKCIRLIRKKLRIFPHGRYIVEMSLYWLSEDTVRFKIEVGVEEKYTKMLTPFPMNFPHVPQHAVIIDDVIIIGTHLLHTYITREARM